jgi:hypothetical protein
MYLADLHREARSFLVRAGSNDGLYTGQLVAHRRRMLPDGESGE